MKPFTLITGVLISAAVSGAALAGPPVTAPYYNAHRGTAVLTNATQLRGRFYYHVAPLSQEVSFYFYPKGPGSQRIIPAARFRRLTILSKADTTKALTFERQQGRLVQTQPHPAMPQVLTQKAFARF